MADLTVQQARQVDDYLKTHKSVSREQAVKILFSSQPAASEKGLKVEKSGSTPPPRNKKLITIPILQLKKNKVKF